MSPPRMARSGDPFDRALLRAGRSDDPPRGAEDRALAALGLPAALPACSLVVRPRPFSTVPLGWSLKAVGVALAVGAVVVGSWVAAFRRPAIAPVIVSGRAAGAADPSVATVPALAALAAPAAPAAYAALASSSAAGGPPVASASVRHAPHGSSGAPSAGAAAVGTGRAAVEAPALPVEIALVEEAARALASGDAAVALGLLDTYDRQCPHGALVDEAGALRVQALSRSGRVPEARALARKLLDAHPRGVLAARLRGVLDGRSDAESR
jgi:hypothetical protein